MRHVVLDTNVLLTNPEAILDFKGFHVHVPIYVIEELDKHKTSDGLLGYNARQASRFIEEITQENGAWEAKASEDILLSIPCVSSQEESDCKNNDQRIIRCAENLHLMYRDTQVTLYSNDLNVRIRARSLGLLSYGYSIASDDDKLYTGISEIDIHSEDKSFYPNEFIRESLPNGCKRLFRWNSKTYTMVPVYAQSPTFGVSALNSEQSCALNLLLDPSVKLVTLVGKAGTGKTLMAIAAGLHQVMEDRIYDKLVVARPVVPMGRDIGYLPGSIQEKMDPWMKPIFDNLDFLFHNKNAEKKTKAGQPKRNITQELIDMGLLQVEPLTYVRGRSMPNQFIVIDEAQNLTKHEIKTIISRAGENTKIVLTGDPQQIDTSGLSFYNNGLIHVVSSCKEKEIVGHVCLVKGERSELAELATECL